MLVFKLQQQYQKLMILSTLLLLLLELHLTAAALSDRALEGWVVR
jgi:hypothetical protein